MAPRALRREVAAVFHPLPAALARLAADRTDTVLLESARPLGPGRTSYLYTAPRERVRVTEPSQVLPALARLDRARRGGAYVAGWLGYDAAGALLGLELPWRRGGGFDGAPLGWFGVYTERWVFDHLTGALHGPPLPGAPAGQPATPRSAMAPQDPTDPRRGGDRAFWLEPPTFGLDRARYRGALQRIDAYLRAGDSYQINFTDAFETRLDADAALWPLYRRWLAAQPVDYAAFVRAAGTEIACLSPELFYRTEAAPGGGDLRAETRPMKGTAPRGPDSASDDAAAHELRADPKSRAENVMIVDLLRNDLGRLARPGSVRVPRLFEVERYPSLLQMTSTVRADLPAGTGVAALFGALFPCGSVTGAPKRRSAEIIAELERGPRGVYTGAIGHAEPSGASAFNVAIRTVERRGAALRMGVGSGVVIDSDPDLEFDECLLKARFLVAPNPRPAIFETLRWEPERGALLLDRHLDRMASAARWHGVPFARAEAAERVERCGRASARAAPSARGVRLRLELRPGGALACRAEALALAPAPLALPTLGDAGSDADAATGEGEPLAAAFADEPIVSGDPARRFKTSDRAPYARGAARAAREGLADLIYLNERGEVAEGAISNLIARFGDRFVTPPVDAGALPGVGRAELLATDRRLEIGRLTPDDLRRADALYLCSALRGVRRVALAGGDATSAAREDAAPGHETDEEANRASR